MKTIITPLITALACLLFGCSTDDYPARGSGEPAQGTGGEGSPGSGDSLGGKSGAGDGKDGDGDGEGSVGTGAYYVIAAKHSGKAIDIPGWSTASAITLQQYERHGGDSQVWQLVDAGDGSYKIVSKHSSKVMSVLGEVSSATPSVVQSDWIDEDRRKWLITPLDEEGFFSINSAASPDKAVKVAGDLNKNDFASLELADWSGRDDQAWSFEKLSEVPAVDDPTAGQDEPDTSIVIGSYYMITARHSEKAMNVSGDSLRSGIIVQQWEQADWDNEKFQVADAGDGYYKLVAKHSGKVLEATGEFELETSAVKSSWLGGTRIMQSFWKDLDSQKWKIVSLNSGYYRINSKSFPNKVVQVEGDLSMGVGARLELGEWKDSLDQHWFFRRLPEQAESLDVSKPYVETPTPSILDIPHSTTEEGLVLEYIHQTRENAIRNGFDDWSFDVDLEKLCGPTTADEVAFEQILNEERAKSHLQLYVLNRNLVLLARIKVDDQMQNDQEGHFSDVYGGPGDMASNFAAVGATSVPNVFGENFCFGNSAEESFTAWMASPAHKAGLLSGGNALGFAIEYGPPAAGRSIAIFGNL